MKKIGLTGGIGVGKTFVSKLFNQLGFPVFNADFEAKKCMVSDLELMKKIKLIFGNVIYIDGKLQKDILIKNSTLVKKDGILVYATCSIFPNENQLQISHFLKSKEGKRFKLLKDQTYLANETGFDGFHIAKLKKS